MFRVEGNRAVLARTPKVSAFVDTNILVRHLTGDPAGLAARATAYLEVEPALLLTDLVVAGTVNVLESFYGAPRQQVAESIRSLLAFDSVVSLDTGINKIISFDRTLDRVGIIERIEPPRR